VSAEQVVGLLIAGSSLGSGLFWTGVTFGRLLTRMERTEGRVEDNKQKLEQHSKRLDEHDDELRLLKGFNPRQ